MAVPADFIFIYYFCDTRKIIIDANYNIILIIGYIL